jgi:hypothetical protein
MSEWFYICHDDRRIFRIPWDDDAALLPAVARCPICRKNLAISSVAQGLTEYVISSHRSKDFFTAHMGHGLPDEQTASMENILFLLKGATVEDAELSEAPVPSRCIINTLTIKNGERRLTLHIGISVLGPTVFKVSIEDK